MSQYRVSAHRLEMVAGRWTKPNKTPLEHRKCKQCNTLEDEFHFVLEFVIHLLIDELIDYVSNQLDNELIYH